MTYTPSDQSLKTTEVNIPSSLAPFFQEYQFEQLDVYQHEALIIERTLAYGNRSEVRWLYLLPTSLAPGVRPELKFRANN